MKFKLDENLPASSARLLAKSGHDVDTVAAEGLTGAADPDVLPPLPRKNVCSSPWIAAKVTFAPTRQAATPGSSCSASPTSQRQPWTMRSPS